MTGHPSAAQGYETGMSDEDIWDSIPEPQSTKDSLVSGVLTAANSALFGFGDEIGSYGAAAIDELKERIGLTPPMDFAERQEGYQTRAREALGQFREERPYTAMGLDVTGGLTSGGIGAAKAGVFKAPSVISKVLRGTAVGAGQGALAGAGYADDGSRTEGAVQGGAIGGLFGGAIGGVSGLVGKIGRSRTASEIRRRISDNMASELGAFGDIPGQSPTQITRAQKHILKIFEDATDDELVEAAMRVEQAAKNKQPLTIFEALDIAQGYADAKAVRASRGGRGVAGRFMQERRRGAVDRLNDALGEISPQDDVYFGSGGLTDAAQDIVGKAKKARTTISKPFYDAAKEEVPVIDSPVIDELLMEPRIKRVMNTVRSDYSRTLGDLPDNHIEVLDTLKKELDNDIGKFRRAGEASKAADLQGFKKILTGTIDEYSDKYNEARRVYGGLSKTINWLEGQKWGDTNTRGILEDILTANPENAALASRRLMMKSPSQLRTIASVFKAAGKYHELRAGIRASFQDVLNRTKTGTTGEKGGAIVDRLFGEENLKAKLDALLGEDETAKLFKKVDIEGLIAKGEAEIGITERGLGSPTAPLLEALGEKRGIMQKVLSPRQTLREAFEALKPGEEEQFTRELAEELFTAADPKKWQKLLQIQRQYNQFARESDAFAAQLQGGVTGATSVGTGQKLSSDDAGAVIPGAIGATAVTTGGMGFLSQPTSTGSLYTPSKKEPKGNMREQDVAAIEELIDQDPIDAAIYETESGRNPLAKNPNSSASGAFQLIKSTAKSLGVKDVFDIEDNYKGYRKLRAQHEKVFGDSPELLYAAHFLGQPLAKKWVDGKKLSSREAELVSELERKALPRFKRIYASIIDGRDEGGRLA